MAALGIGTSRDKDRISDRSSNWMMVRVYRDDEAPVNSPYRYWRLEVYYYTGALDTVPHVPGVCVVAAGATPLGTQSVPFSVSDAREPWNVPLKFRRMHYEMPGRFGRSSTQYVQYYLFSINGRPEGSRKKVRLELIDPRVKYCYFAKVQFAPLGGVPSIEEADRAAEDFMNYLLPVVLRGLPTPADVEAAHEAEKAMK